MNTALETTIDDTEAGQASIFLLLMLSTFLLAVMTFAVDLSNLWFHRQATQAAADSACQAGAMDMMAIAEGQTPPSPGFTYTTTTAAAGNCVSQSSATMCTYANYNGYNGSGFSSTSASNSVSWTFPTSVSGATSPGGVTYPFLKVTVEENIKTWFMALLGHPYQAVAASCTCGLSATVTGAPILVLNPSTPPAAMGANGTLSFGGGATITIVGGPQGSIQVNSTSATAVQCIPSGSISTAGAGPSSTGGNIQITGGPTTAPTNCYGGGFFLGTTGNWVSPSAAITDPYANVPAPTEPLLPAATDATGTNHGPYVVTYGQDGCPDHSPTNYVSTVPHSGCLEYLPGYYPSGISGNANDVIILMPGVYYMGSSFTLGGSDEVRLATPCTPSCGANTTSSYSLTEGVMFYFASGSLQISGGSGALSSSRVDSVSSSNLSCNGTAPNAGLGIPSSVNGNILVAQCTTGGTYYGAPSTDTLSSTGSRGLLVFMGHSNTQTTTTFSGSGALAYSGTMYYHSTSYGDIFAVNGGSGTTAYALGNISADNVLLTGSGAIKMALNSASTNIVYKVSILQ